MEKNEIQVAENNGLVINDIKNISVNGSADVKTFTTIQDAKKVFNLENSCDFKINDCKGELIKVKDVMIKVIERNIDPVVDENGEVIKDKEIKKICILIDDKGKSYVTASKMFTNQFIQYISMFGFDTIKGEGLDIKIIEKTIKNSSNKALGFELA